jgi:diguanylate cyclase (GGDEF)-like protein
MQTRSFRKNALGERERCGHPLPTLPLVAARAVAAILLAVAVGLLFQGAGFWILLGLLAVWVIYDVGRSIVSSRQGEQERVPDGTPVYADIAHVWEQIDGEAVRAGREEEPLSLPDAVFSEIAAAATDDLAAAFELSELLLGDPDADLPRRVLERLQAILPAVSAVFFEVDATGEELVATTVTGAYAALLQGMTIRMGEGVSGRAAQDGRAFLNASAVLDVGRVFDPGEHIELSGALCVPVVVREETVAVLSLYHSSYALYTEHHQRVLATVAGHLATAIELRRQSAEDRELAMTDPATGLYNSRYLLHLLEGKLPLVRRAGQGLAILMLDLDRFKTINDRYGHLAGDEALAAVARQLRHCAREQDVVCRYAGDEFVLVLDGAGGEDAARVAERVRRGIGDLIFWDGLRLGCSIGTALFPEDGSTLKALIAAADARMYSDKARRDA